MKAALFWLLVVAAVTVLAWWISPEPGPPDLSAFPDGGRAVLRAAPGPPGLPRCVSLRYAAALQTFPATAGLLLVALTAGLFLRERARYASPTLAWLAKRIALGGVAVLALFVVAPLGWSIWWLYAAAGITAAGMMVYTANLPRKL